MTLAPGQSLGPYEIVALLGAGGMGEVWRAHDPRLGRDVAIKALPAVLAQDPERVARFEREARLLAALDHPNIARIHGLEEADGARYLVMELAEGEDVAARLARGALPVDEAIAIALQVAAALESAHERGIVHRDLKPANIMVSREGVVKVLDFGLARAFEGDAAASDPGVSQSPTITRAMTQAGLILGTAAYMSPEQARGRTVDRRTDIWAFGAVLYEMLSGRRLFTGETVSETLAAVIKDAPDFSVLPAGLPAGVDWLLRRCLTREPAERLRDIGEARVLLAAPGAAPPSAALPAGARRGVPAWALALVLVAVAALAAFASARWRGSGSDALVSKFEFTVDDVAGDWPNGPALSPDGRRFAYVSANRLWVRDLAQIEPRVVAELAGRTPLAWSPDSRWVTYCDRKKLWKTSADGGTPSMLCDVPASGQILGVAWARDGRVAFTVWREAMYVVPEAGGEPRRYVPYDGAAMVDFHAVSWLPNGQLLYTTHWRNQRADTTMHLAVSVFDGTKAVVVTGMPLGIEVSAHVDRDGTMLVLRGEPNRGVWAVDYDPVAHHTHGELTPVESGATSMSASETGSLLFVRQPVQVVPYEMFWLDRTGRAGEAVGEPHAGLRAPVLSGDGTRVAFAAGADATRGDQSLYVRDLRREGETRLTYSGARDDAPAWSPDGRTLLFAEHASATVGQLMKVPAGGSSPAVAVSARGGAARELVALCPSPDARFLVAVFRENGRDRLSIAPFEPGGSLGRFAPLLQGDLELDVGEPAISPDGRLIAYVVRNADGPEVFVSRFPGGTGRWQVSSGGGRRPCWARGTGELFYLANNGPESRTMVAVAVHSEVDPPVGASTKLFDLGARSASAQERGYDVSADGRRFLLVRRSGDAPDDSRRIVLVQNVAAEIRRLRKGER